MWKLTTGGPRRCKITPGENRPTNRQAFPAEVRAELGPRSSVYMRHAGMCRQRQHGKYSTKRSIVRLMATRPKSASRRQEEASPKTNRMVTSQLVSANVRFSPHPFPTHSQGGVASISWHTPLRRQFPQKAGVLTSAATCCGGRQKYRWALFALFSQGKSTSRPESHHYGDSVDNANAEGNLGRPSGSSCSAAHGGRIYSAYAAAKSLLRVLTSITVIALYSPRWHHCCGL